MSTHIVVRCDMTHDCEKPIAYIDVKGYVYCAEHGIERKDTCRCRKLTLAELRTILRGEPLKHY